MDEEGRYVYCIIECGERKGFGGIGIGGRGDEVYTISYKDISAVVSDTPLKEYEANEENTLTHMSVIQRVMQEYTVLPLRFCTIFKGDDGLRRTLARIYDESKAELGRLKDKVEVGVKVLWHPKVASEHIRKTSDRVKELEKDMEGKTPGIAYLLKIKLDEAMKDELNRRSEDYSRTIYEELKSHTVDSRESRLVGHMILNGAFLLNKNQIENFKGATERLNRKYESYGLEFIFSGPWPPYNFVTIRYE